MKLEQVKYIYKLRNELIKSNFNLEYNYQLHHYDTRSRENIHLDNVSTNIGLRDPIASCAVAYNNLPPNLKNISSINLFKKKVKEEFYNNLNQS